MVDISAWGRLTAGLIKERTIMVATMPYMSGRGGLVLAPGTRCV